MTIERPTKFSGLYRNTESTQVWKPEGNILDPAVEKTTSLFELITLLESIKGKDFPRTVFIGVFSYSTDEKYFPQRRVVEGTLKNLRKVVSGDPGTFPYGDPYYDVFGVSYWDPDAYDENIIQGAKVYMGESPYHTLYPAPALVEGAFNKDYSTAHDRAALVRFVLDGDYADRVIVLPRIRYKGGTLEPEMVFMMQKLIPERDEDLLDEHDGILPGDSILDLPTIPDDELIKVGVPVYRYEESKFVLKL